MSMKDEPLLILSHSFVFQEKKASYSVEFYKRHIIINECKTSNSTKIKYSNLHKLKLRNNTLKIVLKNQNIIEIPCTISEINKIKRIFKENIHFVPNNVAYAAFVEFGEISFFLKVFTNNFDTLRTEIIKRISKFFYPALDHEGISLDLFKNFVFHIRKANRLVLIENSQDLDAALLYFDYKIDIVIDCIK